MATLYFNGAVDNDWNTLTDGEGHYNWWLDDTFSTPASNLPTSSDSVVASANITASSGPAPTVVDFTTNATLVITLTVSGTCTFNNTAVNQSQGTTANQFVFNNSSYNDFMGGLIGNTTFNGTSYNIGDITPTTNVEFNNNSINGVGGDIYGNATFTSNFYNTNPVGTVTGTVTFTNTNHIDFAFYEQDSDYEWNADTSSWIFSNAVNDVPNATWNFYDSQKITGSLTINGNILFNNTSYITYNSVITCIGAVTFKDDSFNNGTIYGDVIFEDNSSNSYTNNGTIYGNVTFNDNSTNGYIGGMYSNIGTIICGSGDTVTFNNNSIHSVNGSITGNVTFNNNSIKRGTVNGTISWNSSYPNDGSLTYYFNGAVNGDWDTLGNWWLNSGFSIPINSIIGLPTSIDNVIASANITTNSGSAPTVVDFTVNGNIYIDIDLTVSGMATFNNESMLGQIVSSSKFINGDATFNNTSILLGTINGNATFNNSAICAVNSNVSTNAEFNNSSIKRGNVGGTITWNSSYPSDGSLTYYFNAAVDNDWNTVGNWWLDSGHTVPLPTIFGFNLVGLPQSIDSVIASANITSNSGGGSTPTVKNFTITDAQMSTDIYITNSATFNGSSSLGFDGGGATILNMTTIHATTTFNNTSAIYGTGGINVVWGQGNGSVVFNDSSFIKTGIINANTTFNDNSVLSVGGSIGEDATFNDSSIKRGTGTVTGTITWNSSYPNDGSLTYYFNNAVDISWDTLGNWWLNSGFNIPINSAIGLPTSIDSVLLNSGDGLNAITSSINEPTIKNLGFIGYNSGFSLSIDLTITDTATFSQGKAPTETVTITGNCIFNTSSNNVATINGNVTFNSGSYNTGSIVGNVMFNNPYDPNQTNQQCYNNGDITGDVTFNHGAYNDIGGIIDGNAIFNTVSHNNSTVTGNAEFNGASYNHGTIGTDGDPPTTTHTFNDSSINYNDGIIYGDSTFNDSSFAHPDGTYNGTITIGTRTPYPIPRGINGSSILGLV